MMDIRDREKLIELLKVPIYPHEAKSPEEVVADYLIDNGVFISKPCDAMPAKDWKFTNADKIRAMTDEELAYWIMCPYDSPYCTGTDQCIECTLEWLKQPAEDEC